MAAAPVAPPRPRFLPLRPGWPLTAILLLYPLWWALGLGVLIFPIAAVPMVVILVRQRRSGRPIALPPGFALWALFLVVVVVSIGALGEDPPGTEPGTVAGRLISVSFRLVEYLALTVLLLYAGNLTEAELPRRRLVRLLGWLFVVTVCGGLLGVVAGRFQFSSPIELLLPKHLRGNSFVQSLVHPTAAQVMDVLGHQGARPAAPWGYTNTWGNNFCLLVVWFAVAAFGSGRRYRLPAVAVLAISLVPVVYSLNRGLWIGLGVAAVAVALRLAVRGRFWAIGALAIAATGLAVALTVTPLGTVVSERLDHGKSNGVRGYLTDKALAGAFESPVVGYGSTRNTVGGRQSIAVGEKPGCPRCGNFTIGGNGQLWQLLYAHGFTGTACYLGFFGYGLWRYRRDASPIGLAGGAALLGSLVAMFWYNALVTPLAFTMLAYALLWRNGRVGTS
ncbi:MAG: hypothetical protein AUG44_28650 [Actinobacteria bacterium 13_1_20CM_3_71_11]|nr:MAG: hypothetical protein AUG44_28650 [Actinobacteria bacterium 13_1_20CM_3_71_11]